MGEIQLLDVVALLEDVSEEGLHRGEVGTVVEVFPQRMIVPERSWLSLVIDQAELMRLPTCAPTN